MKRVLHSPKDRDEIYQRFLAYVEEWRKRLILREWEVNIHLKTEGETTGATARCVPKYHLVVINFTLPDDVESCWSDEEIEDTAIHELIHVLIASWDDLWQRTHKKPLPFRMLNMLTLLEEQLCDRLTTGFLRTKYPRRKALKLTD
ncbi:hypothetical protein LCGC14_2062520 [marine sediment metagenome]|uniref:SprT-like domain-containing protein n=1 Tax=marine sediment metagenome TaxID=412755 RepID=A0A0F9EKM4_9ZZZZ